jgi:hypothetical protein
MRQPVSVVSTNSNPIRNSAEHAHPIKAMSAVTHSTPEFIAPNSFPMRTAYCGEAKEAEKIRALLQGLR